MKLKKINDVRALTAYEQNQLMAALGTKKGFFQKYFEASEFCTTKTEAFYYVNTLFLDLFGEEKYSSYQSFRNQLEKHLKPKK